MGKVRISALSSEPNPGLTHIDFLLPYVQSGYETLSHMPLPNQKPMTTSKPIPADLSSNSQQDDQPRDGGLLWV